MLTTLEQQLKDEEKEAADAISQWQESCAESESRCKKLEQDLQEAIQEKESLGERLRRLEGQNSSVEESSFPTTSPMEDEHAQFPTPEPSKIVELKNALQVAQQTAARDEEILQQWEGKKLSQCSCIIQDADLHRDFDYRENCGIGSYYSFSSTSIARAGRRRKQCD
jgi:chromosome segregation ATPase